MKSILHNLVLFSLFFAFVMNTGAEAKKKNVLFLAIDDLNDWIGCLGGHPQVKTPNLDKLAARGTLFTNAHCQAPVCNPSRTSVLLGLRPSTTGIYSLQPSFKKVPKYANHVTIPKVFSLNGYNTSTLGKIYHGVPPKGEFDKVGTKAPLPNRFPDEKLVKTPQNHKLVDWGIWPPKDSDQLDYKTADWAVNELSQKPKDPFFMAVGFFLPHVPLYASQKWFDLYPDDDSVLPPILKDDRADTPRFSWYIHWSLPEPRLQWVRENNEWRNLVRSYLACTSFVDAQIGRIVSAVEQSDYADNTIIVVWGDHGWHLGEKDITGKNTLWDRGTKVPLIFAGPGVTPQQTCGQPVELLDIYPTLIDLAGVPSRSDLEGISLVPQLKDATTTRTRPAITSHNQGNHGIRSERWRYIRYADGSEELYDMQADPHEWTNLATRPKYASIIKQHRQWLPTIDRDLVPGSAARVLTYDKATDTAVWEGTTIIERTDPIPD